MTELERLLEQNPFIRSEPDVDRVSAIFGEYPINDTGEWGKQGKVIWDAAIEFCYQKLYDADWRPIKEQYSGLMFVSGDYIGRPADDMEGCVCIGDVRCRDCRNWEWTCEEVTFGLLGGE